MPNLLFIPEKLRVGFQKRPGTYDGKLSYVIYYDEKGKIRKETSWASWRDKSIPALELDNKPVSGMCINKSVKRDAYYFGSGRNMMRIYDPRGFEYEISIDNLSGILHYQDVIKGEFQGEFVYAISGTELILLPVDSEQYKEAVKHTQNKNTKISARDFKPGQMYHTKQGKDVVYLGRYSFNEKKSSHSPFFMIYQRGKQHVFQEVTTAGLGTYLALSPASLGQMYGEMEAPLVNEAICSYLDNVLSSSEDLHLSTRPLTNETIAHYQKEKNHAGVALGRKYDNQQSMEIIHLSHFYIQPLYLSNLPESIQTLVKQKGATMAYAINGSVYHYIAKNNLSDIYNSQRSGTHALPSILGYEPLFTHSISKKDREMDNFYFFTSEEASAYAENILPYRLFEELREKGFEEVVLEDNNNRQYPPLL